MTTNAWGVASAAANKEAWADDEVVEEESKPSKAGTKDDFPTLGEAVKQQPAAKKKNKGQKLSLGAFIATGPPAPVVSMRGGSAADRDRELLASLPTAPRAEAEGGGGFGGEGMGLGGGFREYGGSRGGFGDRGDDRRGGFGDRPERRDRDDFQSSRADDVDDWGTTKKFEPGMGGPRGAGGRPGGGGGFSDRPMRPMGAADEVDDWGSTKKFEPSGPPSGGGGFRDRDAPRRPFEGGLGSSRADEEDQWSKGKAFQPSDPPRGAPGGRSSGFGFADRVGEEDRWGRRGTAPDEGPAAGAANGGAPSERPRLKLQPRTLPLPEPAATPAPSDSAEAAGTASPPAAAAAAPQQPPVKKSNPFGAARPREEVLKEKGVDVKQDVVKPPTPVTRDEAPEEKAMQDEIEHMRKKLELLRASAPDPESIADEIASAEEELEAKQNDLVKLKEELDDKARAAKAEAKSGSQERTSDLDAFQDGHPGDRPREGRSKDAAWGAAGAQAPPAARGRSREFAGAPGKERW